MRLTATLFFTLALLTLAGCNRSKNADYDSGTTSAPNTQSTEPQYRGLSNADANTTTPKAQTVSLTDADKSQTVTAAVERKIIRNADLQIEVSDPAENLRRIAKVAEARGGFVVTSDATQRQDNNQTRPELEIKIVVRVPSAQFDATMDEIRNGASRILNEKRTGQDVTEEFIDLEARIRTQKALEAQFMEIMKQAKTVEDALQVQSQLAGVRTEIERLEGRRRFLENQASLSTITVTLQSPTPIVSTSGFFYSVKQAFRDGVDLAATITLFLIRAFITLLPVAVFIFLPLGLLVRYLIRRFRRAQLVRELAMRESLADAKSQ